MKSKHAWAGILAAALFAYGYLLGGLHTPKVGDEYLYLQVTRVTAEQGTILPLVSDEGINNRKPPLLFWVGMLATDMGRELDLLRFRLPVVAYTLLTALLAFLMAGRLARERGGADPRKAGWIAALSFLAFFSTFKYGRNFLTNMPEAFFTFLAVYLLAALPVRAPGARGWLSWVAIGSAVGGVFLHRSVVLAAPIAGVIGLHLLLERGRDLKGLLLHDAPRALLALAVSVAWFGLWFALDPRPEEIVRIFFLDENLGKMNQGNYWLGLVKGNYNLTRIWTGHLINAGLFVGPVIALAVAGWRGRGAIRPQERLMWLLVLVYVAVFTFPQQRSPSYLISGTPALAALLGLYWDRLSARALRLSALPFAPVYLFGAWFAWRVGASGMFQEGFSWFHWPMILAGLGLTVAALARPEWGRAGLLHLNAFVFLIVLSGTIRPLETREGRFPAGTRLPVGATVMAPSDFRARYERYRYLLPGHPIKRYSPRAPTEQIRAFIDRGDAVVLSLEPGEDWKARFPTAVEVASRWDLRTRHNDQELREILLDGRIELLFLREVVLVRGPAVTP